MIGTGADCPTILFFYFNNSIISVDIKVEGEFHQSCVLSTHQRFLYFVMLFGRSLNFLYKFCVLFGGNMIYSILFPVPFKWQKIILYLLKLFYVWWPFFGSNEEEAIPRERSMNIFYAQVFRMSISIVFRNFSDRFVFGDINFFGIASENGQTFMCF